MSIGDINSTEKGSGARYNTGKVKLQLIPVRILRTIILDQVNRDHPNDGEIPHNKIQCRVLLKQLTDWQENEINIASLLNSLLISDIKDAAHVFEYGAKKYAEWNWIKGMPWSEVLGSLLRHIWAICIEQQNYDEESTLPHMGHIACNIIMLVHYQDYYTAGDDCPNFCE